MFSHTYSPSTFIFSVFDGHIWQLFAEGEVNIKHLMTGHKGNSEFWFPDTLNVPRGEAEGNIEVEGKQNSLYPEGPVIK